METPVERKVLYKHELNSEICLIVGTRPGIVMFSPVILELKRRKINHFIIHTGQHYSPNMDADFFRDLQLPAVDYRLEGVAEKKTHGGQTARMIEGIESILMERKPKIVLVGGDANTNLAGALAARKLQLLVGHIEAGERSYDWSMPEEHNRVMIDHISDYLFVTGKGSLGNLKKERIQGEVFETGNPIVDASLQNYELAKTTSTILKKLKLAQGSYALLTLHREENVDHKDKLINALEGVSKAAKKTGIPVHFFAHPRTEKRLMEFDLLQWAKALPELVIHEAVGYLDFLHLLGSSRIVFTDSGGVQQEACIHKIPCVTLRDNTEWTETIDIGANKLTGCNQEVIVNSTIESLNSKNDWNIPFGAGDAASRIIDIVVDRLSDEQDSLK